MTIELTIVFYGFLATSIIGGLVAFLATSLELNPKLYFLAPNIKEPIDLAYLGIISLLTSWMWYCIWPVFIVYILWLGINHSKRRIVNGSSEPKVTSN